VLEAGWKRQRPWNRTMVQAREKQMLVTYLSPMLLGLEEPLCQELAERLREALQTDEEGDFCFPLRGGRGRWRKKTDHHNNTSAAWGGEIPAVFDVRNGFHDYIVPGSSGGKNKQNYADKIRHAYDKRNGKNHRGQYKSDDQSIPACVERTERTDSL